MVHLLGHILGLKFQLFGADCMLVAKCFSLKMSAHLEIIWCNLEHKKKTDKIFGCTYMSFAEQMSFPEKWDPCRYVAILGSPES